MFFKKKEDEETPALEGAEETAATEETSSEEAPAEASEGSEAAPEVTPEQLIDQRNAAIVQLQAQLGALRENAALQEQQALALLAKAREDLRAAVKDLAASRDIDVDDGRWNFDLTSKEFSKIN
jgi:hypothetical protein